MVRVTANPPHGTPSFIDIGLPDLDRAKEFYGGLFGWRFESLGDEAMGYEAVLLGDTMIAGMAPATGEDTGGRHWWNLYFATDDADGTLKRIADAGGSVVQPAVDVADQGRLAMAKDPAGGQFGLWQGAGYPGSRIVNEPGSFSWEELYTRDTGAAAEFYRNVFDLRPERLQEPFAPSDMDYVLLRHPDAGRPAAGICSDDRDVPLWVVYFEVADTDEAVRRAQDGGATLDAGPWDTPYGRVAGLHDPFGVDFRLLRSNPPS
ncbi:VOC family protein [Actinomadura gamaensis]|uniref:VOC family protein n=1 Tax=Actinomadura gamaensis TaxID=1763541 RepID=A0ABV9U0C5_9ACTN